MTSQCLQGTPGSSRGTSKPWAPPAVIDDNSSAFVRYAVSHRAFAGSGPPSRQSSATLSSQVRVFLKRVLCLMLTPEHELACHWFHALEAPLDWTGMCPQGNGTRQQSIAERMLAGQRLNSTRLKSQELPEYEPSEEQAEDDEAPRVSPVPGMLLTVPRLRLQLLLAAQHHAKCTSRCSSHQKSAC